MVEGDDVVGEGGDEREGGKGRIITSESDSGLRKHIKSEEHINSENHDICENRFKSENRARLSDIA
jgi:hypothetical protein